MKEIHPNEIKHEGDFKYPTIRMFFDVDRVACVFFEEVLALYPHLEEEFRNKCWGIHEPNGDYVAVMSASDVSSIIELDHIKSNGLKQE